MAKKPIRKYGFTKPKLAALDSPKNGREYHYDERVPGLAICVTNKGTKTFYYIRRIEGRPERIKLGRFPEISIEKARTLVAKLAGEIADGNNPQRDRKSAKVDMTFGQLFAYFMENHSRKYKKTWKEDEKQFERYLTRLSSRKLSTISSDELRSLHTHVGENNGVYAANRMLALISSMYSNGPTVVSDGINPAKGIKRFEEKERERFLQSDELPRFFSALDEVLNPSLRDFFWIAILTGSRKSKILEMRWAELQLDRAVWRIPNTKNGDPVTVHLTPEIVAILNRRASERNGSEWVFPSYGRTGHLVETKSAWDRIREKAKLPDVRLHDLRRTLGSYQAANGTSLAIIGKTLGHRSQATTAIYARLNLDPVRKSVDSATENILRAGSVKIERDNK